MPATTTLGRTAGRAGFVGHDAAATTTPFLRRVCDDRESNGGCRLARIFRRGARPGKTTRDLLRAPAAAVFSIPSAAHAATGNGATPYRRRRAYLSASRIPLRRRRVHISRDRKTTILRPVLPGTVYSRRFSFRVAYRFELSRRTKNDSTHAPVLPIARYFGSNVRRKKKNNIKIVGGSDYRYIVLFRYELTRSRLPVENRSFLLAASVSPRRFSVRTTTVRQARLTIFDLRVLAI